MRTSLNEIKLIEDYLTHCLNDVDRLAFEERMLKDYHFRVNVSLQRKIYQLLPVIQKRNLKQRAEQVHQRIFNSPEKSVFRNTILKLF